MALSNVEITWLGHSTFLIKTPEGKTLLVDPWLEGNPKCPDEFNDVDVDGILITHGHNDHIGDVFSAAKNCAGPIVGIFDLTSWLATQGVDGEKLVGMNKGGTLSLADQGIDVEVSMTHALHSSSFQTDEGEIVYLGDPAGFVLKFSNGESLYIAGDTSLFGDMEWIAKLYEPTAAILPIGDHFTMGPRQAAYAVQLLDVDTVIPCHYATFPALSGTPGQLEEELAKLGVDADIKAVDPGESIGG